MKRIKFNKLKKTQHHALEYTGIYKDDPVEMQLFIYNNGGFEEYKNVSLAKVSKEINNPLKIDDVKWFNIHGLHNVELIKSIGTMLEIEPFILNEILNVNRRSKMEELDDVLFFNIKSILPGNDLESMKVEQISFILKENLLVSFQEKRSDFFTHIRESIKTNVGLVRKKKSDYLLYLLLEAVMDNFFVTIDFYEDKIEALMIEAKTNDNTDVLVRIEKNRENLNFLKHAILPLRDALFNLKIEKNEEFYDGIEKTNYIYFTRLYQKTLEILEQIGYDMNTLDSASSFYFSTQNHKMNQTMKILTAVSVIFMPLTFIVGVYGMNFDTMPELRYKFGYLIVMIAMFLMVVAMVIYFKKKKWF